MINFVSKIVSSYIYLGKATKPIEPILKYVMVLSQIKFISDVQE